MVFPLTTPMRAACSSRRSAGAFELNAPRPSSLAFVIVQSLSPGFGCPPSYCVLEHMPRHKPSSRRVGRSTGVRQASPGAFPVAPQSAPRSIPGRRPPRSTPPSPRAPAGRSSFSTPVPTFSPRGSASTTSAMSRSGALVPIGRSSCSAPAAAAAGWARMSASSTVM